MFPQYRKPVQWEWELMISIPPSVAHTLATHNVKCIPYLEASCTLKFFPVYFLLCIFSTQVEDWKSKNQMLRSQLRHHGIVAASSMDPQ